MSKTTSFGFLSEQVKSVHKDLLAFQEKTERRFDRLESKIDGLESKVDGLAKALPGIVGDAVREAIRDRDRKR